MDDLEKFKTSSSVEEVNTHVVEIAGQVKEEFKDMTELLKFYDKTLTHKELLLMEEGSCFFRWNLVIMKIL